MSLDGATCNDLRMNQWRSARNTNLAIFETTTTVHCDVVENIARSITYGWPPALDYHGHDHGQFTTMYRNLAFRLHRLDVGS